MMKKGFFGCALALFIISCGQDSDILSRPEALPGKATLIFPENNSECTEGVILSDTRSEVTFRWEETENTTEYILKLRNLRTDSLQNLTSASNELPVTLDRGTPYAWSVLSRNTANDQSSESEVWAFYNAGIGSLQYVPFPAEAVFPEPDSVIPTEEGGITLQWTASDLDNDILEYDLYFGTTDPPPLTHPQLSGPESPLLEVEPGTVYYWQILTRDEAGNESDSRLFSFEVE